MEGIILEIAQHCIELDTLIPPICQTWYILNPNYVSFVKQNIDKLLAIGFIQPMEKVSLLWPTVVVPKKNGKLWIYVDFWELNITTKKDPYSFSIYRSILLLAMKLIHFWMAFLDIIRYPLHLKIGTN